jgi:hypothetical protein
MKALLFSLFFVISLNGYCQAVGINNSMPDASSVLDIVSTQKGVLIPRMSSTQRLAITSPATGLSVFQIPENQTWLFNGTVWQFLPAASQQVLNITSSPSIIWDMAKGQLAKLQLTASGKLLDIQNMLAGTTAYITIQQDAIGLRTLQLPVGSKVQNGAGGILYLTIIANAYDVVSIYFDGTHYFFSLKKNFN